MSDNDDLLKLLRDESCSLSDLSWFDVSEEDYREFERLPLQNLDAIPELEMQWKNLSEPEIFRLSPENREPQFAHTPFWSENEFLADLSDEAKVEAVHSILKDNFMKGASTDQILKTLKRSFDKETLRVASHLIKKAFREEHGLLGTVYIEASMFPECTKGVGKEQVLSQSKTSKYILAADKCSGCVLAQQGRCSVFKKDIVVDVDYNTDLWDHHKTNFESVGKDLSSLEKLSSIKDRIRKASLITPSESKESRRIPVRNETLEVSEKQAKQITALKNERDSRLALKKDRESETFKRKEAARAKKEPMRKLARSIMAGKNILAWQATLPETLEPHRYLLGSLYLDVSFFDTNEQALRSVKGSTLPVFGLPQSESSCDFSLGTLDLKHSKVLRPILSTYRGFYNSSKGDLKKVSGKLQRMSSDQVLKFAKALYSSTYRKFNLGTSSKIEEMSIKQALHYEDVVPREEKVLKVPTLNDFIPKLGQDYVDSLDSRIGLATCKKAYISLEGRQASLTELSKVEKQIIIGSIIDTDFIPKGLHPPLPEFFDTKIGTWMRTQMHEGRAGSQLSNSLYQNFSQEDLLKNAPMILAFREEEGLYGKAYTTADSFSDCHTGSKTVTSSVSQVVSGDKCKGCIHNKIGSCQIYGKELVTTPKYSKDQLSIALKSRSPRISKEDVRSIFASDRSFKDKTQITYLVPPSKKSNEYTGYQGSQFTGSVKTDIPSKVLGQVQTLKSASAESSEQALSRTNHLLGTNSSVEAPLGTDILTEFNLTESSFNSFDLNPEKESKPLIEVTLGGLILGDNE